jgi:hypothetical protein
LILNLLGREIGSGRHHTYRGRLSIVGMSLRSCFVWVLNQQKAEGFRAADDVKFALETLREEIADAG